MTLKKYLRCLNSVDRLLLSYIFVTSVYILIFKNQIESSTLHLVFRLILTVLILLLPFLDSHIVKPGFIFFRIAYPLSFLCFFYSETDALNNIFFNNLDPAFARFDAFIFGFQPSLVFSSSFPFKWVSELMNFAYFSYYFLVMGFIIYIFRYYRDAFVKVVFLITCSFFLYYIIFILLPVAGPQYYFEHPNSEIADSGFFRGLVKWVELIGERPTAAFPSSHVGIVFILALIAWPKYVKTYYWLIPMFLLLSLSTVYIKAHFAVDVLGGLISAPIILWLSHRIWDLLYSVKTIKIAYATDIDC